MKSESSDEIVFLGSSEVFGRFVANPFVDIIEQSVGLTCRNLGAVNAGIDSFLQDPVILRRARKARICVLQVMGAQNMSNALYRVHPRRNDRFLEALPKLIKLYPDLDFTQFHFNRHLMTVLRERSKSGFATVRAHLQGSWLAKMRLLIRILDGTQLILVKIDHGRQEADGGMDRDPLLITSVKLAELKSQVADVVEISALRAGRSQETDTMLIGPLENSIARHSLGPQSHRQIARRLQPALQKLLVN